MLSLDTGKTDVFLQKRITTKSGEKIYVKNLVYYGNIRTFERTLIILLNL